jgi:exopolysaccharide biosynthesis WecB/TagA/CpsF family protein
LAPTTFRFGPVPCSTHTIGNLVDEVRQLLMQKAASPRTVLCLNAHIFNVAAGDSQLRRDLGAARVVAADGMSVVWAARVFGVRIPERCNMTEAFRAFLLQNGMPVNTALLAGMLPDEAAAAAAAVNRMSEHCRVVQTASGFLSDAEYQRLFARHTSVDFVLLGMSTPRTERVAALAAAECPRAIVWGIGAGTIRIFAGSMHEAPVLWRRLGVQWLFRLASEPRALWRRYLLGNPLFVARVLAARWRQAGRGHAAGADVE